MIAEHLIRRRKALGLSGPALAREIGVSESTLWRWENRNTQPNAVVEKHVEQVLRRLERRHPEQAATDGSRAEGSGRPTIRSTCRACRGRSACGADVSGDW